MIARIAPVVLLCCSNVFMTFAWYGHLKFKDKALWLVVIASWGIAFFEYCLAIPANRIGSAVYSPMELKGDPGGDHPRRLRGLRRHLSGSKDHRRAMLGFALIAGGAFLVFRSQPVV